jgi:hypothetical protein
MYRYTGLLVVYIWWGHIGISHFMIWDINLPISLPTQERKKNDEHIAWTTQMAFENPLCRNTGRTYNKNNNLAFCPKQVGVG